MTTTKSLEQRFKELLEAAEYLGNATIMIEETLSDKHDLESVYNDIQTTRARAKKLDSALWDYYLELESQKGGAQ